MKGIQGVWSRATALAAATPASRNRYVDFLRALSICAVVVGHWLAVHQLDYAWLDGKLGGSN